MRYFLLLSYHGGAYAGWQRQLNASTVQETLEKALTTLLRRPTEITGCGRTDTGVHARNYVAHFDGPDEPLPGTFLRSFNSMLPFDIAVYEVQAMHPEAHARFDAVERSYTYRISTRKDPFTRDTAWAAPRAGELDLNAMQAVADLLPQYDAFAPFCKTGSDAKHFRCKLTEAYWETDPQNHLILFHITANRFLRGMVRLIVGACVLAGQGQVTREHVRDALEAQTPLKGSLSVPAHGLFFEGAKYGSV